MSHPEATSFQRTNNHSAREKVIQKSKDTAYSNIPTPHPPRKHPPERQK
ncbi:9461_t:CDS:1, partial [Ambispora leptoticha]